MTVTQSENQEISHTSSRQFWKLLAFALAAFHIAYVVFVLFGAPIALFWPDAVWIHLAAVAWAGGTMLFDFGCPVTMWEKSSLRRAGDEPYPEGFLQHHMLRMKFDPARTRRNHIVLGIGALMLNAVIYFLMLRG